MRKLIIFFAFSICYSNTYVLNEVSENTDLNRITNGNFAADTQFPYAVSIQNSNLITNTTRGHTCGGVLISYQHVLTAASCASSFGNQTYRVFAGSAILTNDGSPDRIRSVANYTLHPGYLAAPSLLNDIAVVTLTAPFPNTTVIPLTLPAATFDPADFTVCTVVGWGASVLGNSESSELRFASKYVYNQHLCTSLYNIIAGTLNIFPSMICAASYDIISSGCTGDIGNALVCNGQLTGILSLTNNCQASSYPEVYTRVSNYTTWIREVTGGASSSKPEIVLLGLFTLIQIVTIKIFS